MWLWHLPLHNIYYIIYVYRQDGLYLYSERKRTDRQTDGRTDGQTERHRDRQTDRQTERLTAISETKMYLEVVLSDNQCVIINHLYIEIQHRTLKINFIHHNPILVLWLTGESRNVQLRTIRKMFQVGNLIWHFGYYTKGRRHNMITRCL